MREKKREIIGTKEKKKKREKCTAKTCRDGAEGGLSLQALPLPAEWESLKRLAPRPCRVVEGSAAFPTCRLSGADTGVWTRD